MRTGRIHVLRGPSTHTFFAGPRWSPRGSAIVCEVVHKRGRGIDDGITGVVLSIVDVDTRTTLGLTDPQLFAATADWSPDGSTLVYSALPVRGAEAPDLFTIRPDRTGRHRITTVADHGGYAAEPTFTPDGRTVVFSGQRRIVLRGPTSCCVCQRSVETSRPSTTLPVATRAGSGDSTPSDESARFGPLGRVGAFIRRLTRGVTRVPAIIDKLLRIGEGKILRQLEAVSRAVNAIEDDFVAMSDDELQAQTAEFKERLADGESLDDLMPEAFATVREAAKRVIGQRHYDVQIMGGAALHLGNIAEMKTGEGKTLRRDPAGVPQRPGRATASTSSRSTTTSRSTTRSGWAVSTTSSA